MEPVWKIYDGAHLQELLNVGSLKSNPSDTRRKLNVQNMYKKRQERFVNVLYMFNLRFVPRTIRPLYSFRWRRGVHPIKLKTLL